MNDEHTAWHHEFAFDAQGLPSGTYVVRMEAGNTMQALRRTLLREEHQQVRYGSFGRCSLRWGSVGRFFVSVRRLASTLNEPHVLLSLHGVCPA